jgi:hypothetical protein
VVADAAAAIERHFPLGLRSQRHERRLGRPEMRRTALYGRHVDAGARLIDFGGWEMPVQYRAS